MRRTRLILERRPLGGGERDLVGALNQRHGATDAAAGRQVGRAVQVAQQGDGEPQPPTHRVNYGTDDDVGWLGLTRLFFDKDRGADVIKTRGTERAGRPDTDPREQVYSEAELRAVVDDGAGVDHHWHQKTRGRPTRVPSRALR